MEKVTLFRGLRTSREKSANYVAKKPTITHKTNRQISGFLQGLLTILAAKLNGKGISLNGLFPFQMTLPQPIAVNSS